MDASRTEARRYTVLVNLYEDIGISVLDLYKITAQWQVPSDIYLQQLERMCAGYSSGASPEVVFGGASDDFWLWANTEGYRQSPMLRTILPSTPEEEVQLRSNGIAGDLALVDGFIVQRWIKAIYEAHVGPMANTVGVLDFGCGWGRVLRFFMKDVQAAKLHGIDHYRAVVDIARQTNHWCDFAVSEPFGPTQFEPDSLDLVFAYSVFSHLSEDAHLKWLDEFHRILRPGGLVIATTWERDLIVRCAQLRANPGLPFYQQHLPTMFRDTKQWLAAYDSGQFCFDSSEESYGAISWYLGEACIPKGYVLNRWSQHFDLVDFIEDRRMCSQNVIVVRK